MMWSSIPIEGAFKRNKILVAQGTSFLQDMFLKHLRDHQVEVTIFLANGIRLQGQIRSFDSYTVRLVRGTGTQLVYKHAISAIYPAVPIEMPDLSSFG
ncbi:RNA chaperone Hfq [Microvirga arabica]|uniref:RNA chaperone Hfq n=1 Tax=Microvirga arabica TaxID=1128671 RepID=UPI0028B0A453|nr:RNA chaperone Hfq [Microvirga arabica]